MGPGPILDTYIEVFVGDVEVASAFVEVIGSRDQKPLEIMERSDQPLAAGIGREQIERETFVRVAFTDMHGRKWTRRASDQPERVFESSGNAPQPRRSEEGGSPPAR